MANVEYMICSRLVTLKSTVISSEYVGNHNSEMLDKISYVVGKAICAYNKQSCCNALLIDRYSDRLLPVLMQFLLIPNRNSKYMDFVANCSTLCINKFWWDLIYTW
jgi:hypothetical protein